MKNYFLVFILFSSCYPSIKAIHESAITDLSEQKNIDTTETIISGKVLGRIWISEKKFETDSLFAATVMFTNLKTDSVFGVLTDDSGKYRTKISPGEYSIKFNYVAYFPLTIPKILIEQGKNIMFNVLLQSNGMDLKNYENKNGYNKKVKNKE